MEQVEILANAPVIAPLRLLEPVQILVELLLVGPGGAVNALQHLVARIATPVSPRDLGELEGLELAGGRHMRSAAQVDPVALPVEADFLLLRNAGDDLGLVDLTQSPEELHRLIARHDAAGDFLVRLGQLGHLRFDGREILRREGALVGKVVVKAVLDDRADGDLRLREQLLHRLRQQVRRGVADDLEPFRVPVGHDGETRVLGNDVGGVDQLAVHARGERRLAQPGANAARDLVHGHRVIEAALTAIGQCDNGHSGDFS